MLKKKTEIYEKKETATDEATEHDLMKPFKMFGGSWIKKGKKKRKKTCSNCSSNCCNQYLHSVEQRILSRANTHGVLSHCISPKLRSSKSYPKAVLLSSRFELKWCFFF